MALNVGRLLVQLGIDDSGFSAGMNGARSEYQRTGQSAAQLAQQVEKSAARVQSARASEQAAAVRVQAAEQSLAKLRASGSTDALKMAQAESKLQSALASQNSAALRAAEASRSLAGAKRAQAQGTTQVVQANQRATKSTNDLARAATVAKGALAAMGIGFSLQTMIAGLTQSVAAARALGAQTNQMNVIFGESADKINAWGKNASDTLRMSQREAQGAAIQFATFGKAMGLSGDQLVAFSTQQAKLAADLASFQGMPVADAIQAMGSAYAGETETMRQYGVLLDENTIKQAAYANGIAASGAELTAAQKAQGVYYAMQEQLAHVNGDVERSNGKFGASLKTLTARLEETQAAVGQKLIPVIQPFVDLLAGPGLGAVEGIAGAIGAAASAFSSLPGPVQGALAAIVAFRIGSRLMGDHVSNAVDRTRTSLQTLGQTATIATAQGTVQMGRFGSAVAGIGRHIPVVQRMQTSFVNAAVEARRFPAAAGAMAAGMTGLKGAASGLMGALGGPWGLAIAGASAALGLWMQKKQEDAAKSQEAAAATQSWADQLTESGGKITKALRTDVFRAVDDDMTNLDMTGKSLMKSMNDLGFSSEEVVSAILKQGDAYDTVMGKLEAMRDQKTKGNKEALYEAATAFEASKMLYGLAQQSDAAKSKAQRLAEANGDVAVSFDETSTAVGGSTKAMTEFEESTDGAASKVDKLAKALSGLQDDELTQEEALQAWSDNLRDLVDALGEGAAAMIKLDGSIDVETEKGSKLQDSVVAQRDAYNQTAAAALEYARAQKMGPGEALDYVNGKLAPLRQRLIDTAIAAGVNADTAKKMADRYLGVPGEITTKLALKGADAAIAKLDEIGIKGARTIESKYQMMDNTAELRLRLDQMKMAYSVIDGKIIINDNDIGRAKSALEELGVQTESLPDGFVKITDTSDANIARLERLGIEVEQLPDGTIVINPDDAEFWRRVQAAERPGSKTIRINYVDQQGRTVSGIGSGGTPLAPDYYGSLQRKADGGLTEYASGAIRPAGVPSMPDQAVIEKGRGSGLVRWAEGETWWESYIPGAPSKRKRSTAILAETARRFGYQLWPTGALIRPYADGGVTTPGLTTPIQQSMWNSVSGAFPGATMSSGTRYADVGSGFDNHMGGTAIDITASASEMMSIAAWIADNYPDSKELIHGPGFARQIKDGKIVGDGGGDYGFYAGAGRHDDHVHWAMGHEVGAAGLGARQQPLADVTLTRDSSREDVARKIIAEGRKRGYTDDEIKAVLATAIQESNLDPSAQGGGGAWHGIFQQDGSYAGRDDPNTNISGFYDRLDEKRSADPGADIYDSIFWLQQRPGDTSAANAVANGRQGYLSEIKSKDDEAAAMLGELGPSVGSGLGAADGLGGIGATSGSGTPVYVTNWPSGGNYSAGDTGGSTTSPTSPAPSPGGGGGRPRIIFRDKNGRPILNGGDGGTTPTPAAPNTKTADAPKASSVEAAKAAVDKAQRSLAEANEKQRIAEMKLDEVRANPKAKPSQIASAEAAVARAKNDVADATDKQRIAELKLQELQSKSDSGTPAAPPVKRLNGGTIPGVGRGDIIPMLGEPGEEVIRRPVAEKYRALLKQVNRTGEWPTLGQVPRYQTGGTVGFGGYADDTSDYMKPKSWNDLMALGVGGAFMAADLVQPYLAMAQSGNIDLGSLSPQLNTGSNSADLGIPQMVGEYADDIKEQLAEIARLLAKGERITVHIEQDKSDSAASMVGLAGRV